MNEMDDHDWLDALAGRGTSHTATGREAQALRLALRAAHGTADNVVPLAARDASREQELLERAVREGLLERAQRRKIGLLPIAAGLALIFMAGLMIRTQLAAPDFEVVRSVDGNVVRLLADDPAALKSRILAALRAAGVDATGYEALGVHGIDADLPQPLTPEVRGALAQFDIPEPTDGELRVEIRSRE
jgi:hypothetical protein